MKKIEEIFNIQNIEKNNPPKYSEILSISRQDQIGDLSPFFDKIFSGIDGAFLAYAAKDAGNTFDALVDKMNIYSKNTGINDFVVGISGGADSAVTLSILNELKKVKRDVNIHAYSLPINQNLIEIDRANAVCDHLNIKLKTFDMTNFYLNSYLMFQDDEVSINPSEQKIRNGNIKARMRMIYLYDKAKKKNGVVVSTDNYSEYMAGFWTINGDVGDVSPLQYCFKSTEVPALGKHIGLPEHIWKATPTDGLGISNSDEDQLGFSYLEFDLLTVRLLTSYFAVYLFKQDIELYTPEFYDSVYKTFNKFEVNPSADDLIKIEKCMGRIKNSWFKRHGAVKFESDTLQKSMFEQAMREMSIPKKLFDIVY